MGGILNASVEGGEPREDRCDLKSVVRTFPVGPPQALLAWAAHGLAAAWHRASGRSLGQKENSLRASRLAASREQNVAGWMRRPGTGDLSLADWIGPSLLDQVVLAMPYDTPVPGYRNNTVNTMRLW